MCRSLTASGWRLQFGAAAAQPVDLANHRRAAAAELFADRGWPNLRPLRLDVVDFSFGPAVDVVPAEAAAARSRADATWTAAEFGGDDGN